jgi:hypothetical protein
MSEKQIRKFASLKQIYKEAAEIRKESARARKAIKGLGGSKGDLVAVASQIYSDAVKAELEALRAERRSLKKLHVYVVHMVHKAEKNRGAKRT